MNLHFTKTFVTGVISMFLTTILMVNIIYAFDLFGELGLPIMNPDSTLNYDTKYFGFTSIIDGFKSYFAYNQILQGFQNAMERIYSAMNWMSFDGLLQYTPIYNLTNDVSGGIIGVLIGILNALVNVPFMILAFCYFLIFLIYILFVIVNFILFLFYLLSGSLYSELPNTYSNVILSTITRLVIAC